MPLDIVQCIESWRNKMPEYELVLWDKTKFDITSVPFTEEACRIKKWATASDYIRLYAIYTEGGVYMDSDVYVLQSFDGFLSNSFFTSLEYHKNIVEKENVQELLNGDGTRKYPQEIFTRGIGIQSAVLGGVKGHPFIKACMEWYKNNLSSLTEGTYNNKITATEVYADIAIQYGFRYKDELQKLANDIVIYPSKTFAGSKAEVERGAYAVHCCKGSWREKVRLYE